MEIELIARLQSSRKGETDTAPADIHLRQSRELDGFFTHPHETVKNGLQYPIYFFEPRHEECLPFMQLCKSKEIVRRFTDEGGDGFFGGCCVRTGRRDVRFTDDSIL